MKLTILKTTFWLLLLTFSSAAIAQKNAISELEASLRDKSGVDRVETLFKLTDAYLNAGQPQKAEDAAADASDFARRLKLPELRAQALNREGKLLQRLDRRKTAPKFEQSLQILRESNSGNRALALDNLDHLRQLAEKSGRPKDLERINAQIAVLKNGGKITEQPADSKQALEMQLNAVQKQLAENQTVFKESQSKLLQESQALQSQLAVKEAEIDRMTQEQMRTAMLVMQQRVLLDSVYYRAGMDSLAVANANLALREAESNRKFNYSIMGVLLLLAGGSMFSFVRARQNALVLAEKNKTIKEEQERSEKLLLNILPSLIADELKANGRTKAQYFEDVSVLFADFVGFSKIAERLSPQQLVSELDICFQKFDEIIAHYNLEKIKTIGDAYMCAGGVPYGNGAQMTSMVAAAFDMQHWLHEWNNKREQAGMPRFDARIGIHRGPVVAGVVGSKKFAFDIWGDTVNIAARIEQAGEGGQINISGEAYEVIKDQSPCRYRGKIPAKNKGEIDMYFLEIPKK